MKKWLQERLGRMGSVKQVVGGALVAVSPVVSFAQTSTTSSIDYSSLTSSVDWTSTIAAVLAVAATLVTLYMAIKGARIVLSMIRGR